MSGDFVSMYSHLSEMFSIGWEDCKRMDVVEFFQLFDQVKRRLEKK